MNKILHTKWKYAFPLFHFFLSFFYERKIFFFQLDRDIIYSIPRNSIISDEGERILGYVISKAFALLVICFLWNLLFFLMDSWRKNYLLFLGLFLIGSVFLLLLWPEPIVASQDNFITYSYAIRFWPEYWHGAYTSCLYAAILMAVPHPVFLTVFQWLFGVFVLGYLYNRILDSPVLQGRGRYGLFLIFLMPGAYTLFTNPYRTELYALLCLFLVSATIMDMVDQRRRPVRKLPADVLLCAFVGIWRTEGIILGVILFALQILFLYRLRPRKAALWALAMAAALAMFFVPQKLGDIKYYGKDYSFINSLPTLRNILASPGANLSYEGAEQDLAAIGAVTPVEILRHYGMEGYRRYNYANGRGDINQSLADDETAAAYLRAYYRILAHNFPIYARTQTIMVLKALMIKPAEYVVADDQVLTDDLPPWTIELWGIGQGDLYAAKGAREWQDTVLHQRFCEGFFNLYQRITKLLQKTYVYSLILVCISLYEVILFFAEVIRSVKKKDGRLGLAGIAFMLIGQAAAICLVMPAGELVYLHTYYYCSFLLCLLYTCYRMQIRNRKEK